MILTCNYEELTALGYGARVYSEERPVSGPVAAPEHDPGGRRVSPLAGCQGTSRLRRSVSRTKWKGRSRRLSSTCGQRWIFTFWRRTRRPSSR